MFRLCGVLCLAAVLPAQERWFEYRFGPFELLTNAGGREGRETLAQLEQFRHALGTVLGKKELESVWPVRILLFKSRRDYSTYASFAGLALARDAYTGGAAAKEPLAGSLLRDCARILMESSIGRLPEEMEAGLADVFSTLETDGSRISLGKPPPVSERSRNWAKMHMLTVPPDYYGKLRVLVHNLEQGVAVGPAYRNAFGKSPEEINRAVDTYLQRGNFSSVPLFGRPLNPEKDFESQPVDPSFMEAAMADLLLADPNRRSEARKAFEAILKSSPRSPEALEGVGLLVLRDNQKEEARKLLAAAVEAESRSARAHFEYARLEQDIDKSRAAFAKAAELNPRWAAPHFELAQRESNLQKKIEHLAAAAKLEPRNAAYWRALAQAYEAQSQFSESAQAWASAELAASSEEERTSIREVREEIERKRAEHEAAERRRLEEEKRRELEKLKQEAIASIQAALEKTKRENAPDEPEREVVPWWEGPKPEAKVQGVLQRVDCLGKQIRLVIEGQDGKPVRLVIRDPAQVVILGGGQQTLGCGPQRPPRKIVVEYSPKPDAKLGTAGEAAVIDFP